MVRVRDPQVARAVLAASDSKVGPCSLTACLHSLGAPSRMHAGTGLAVSGCVAGLLCCAFARLQRGGIRAGLQPTTSATLMHFPSHPPSHAQGEGLESAIACPAWAPVLSLESIDGQLWREMRDEFDALMKQLPPPARLQVRGAFSPHVMPMVHAAMRSLPPAAGLQRRALGLSFCQMQQSLSQQCQAQASPCPSPVASQP